MTLYRNFGSFADVRMDIPRGNKVWVVSPRLGSIDAIVAETKSNLLKKATVCILSNFMNILAREDF